MGNLKSKAGMAENDKNPLGEAFSLFLGLVFIIPAVLIVSIFNKGQFRHPCLTQPLLVTIIESIVRAAFVITFLIAYRKKLMLAWWTAMLFFPVALSVSLILYAHLLSWKALALYGVMCFVFIFYLAQRYKPYRNFVDKAHSETLKPD
jgi:hypothetical protein